MPHRLSQRNHAPDRATAVVDGWHELQVADPTFLLERLGSECTDLQGLRELTVNGLDAIAALGDGASGRVMWDLDWQRFDASGSRVRKLSVTDTGTGMTPEHLREYINQLASSGREQSASGNFGVGAKVAAGSRNPHGLEYRSWHHGQGARVCFKRHPDGRWGLEPQRWPDGRSDFWRALDEQDKPWLLRGQDHGTQVLLLGRHERHDTTQPADSVTEGRRQWITRYLNGRFLRLPEQVEVLVAEQHGHDQPGKLRRIHGERHHLQQRAIAAGVVELSDAIAHWWVLDDDHRARRRESSLWFATGHTAAVYCDELYDILPQTRGGYGRLQDFGIRFGYERVVLHLEPHVQPGRVQCNTARTLLLLDHEPLPWARWGEEFAAAMPAEILQLQERAASAEAVGAAAFVCNERLDVLAANQLGYALYSELYDAPARPVNTARFVFLDPRAEASYPEWDRVATETVAILRSAAGRDPYNRELSDLVGELATQSEAFRTRWAQHNVRFHNTGVKQFHHPVVGELSLSFNRLDLAADAGLTLFTYAAEPGSRSEDALKLLGSWAATIDPAEPARATDQS